jgi:hypothetical protein
MLEQLVRVTRIFASDQVDVFENLKRAVSDIGEIANRRRDKKECSRHKRRQDYKINRLVLSIRNPVYGQGHERKFRCGLLPREWDSSPPIVVTIVAVVAVTTPVVITPVTTIAKTVNVADVSQLLLDL